jgi:hypothetical protein
MPETPAATKPPLTPEEKRRRLIASIILAAIAFLALFPVPVLVALPFSWLARRHLRRLESIVLIILPVVYLSLYIGQWPVEYAYWYGALVGLTKKVSVWDIPYLTLLSFASLGAGLAGLVRSFSFLKFGIGAKITAGHDEQILPTATERVALASTPIAATGSTLYTNTPNSLTASVEPGKRDFPIGVDKTGNPVTINENEIRMHGLLFGSTGSGKSETIKVLAAGLLDLGWNGIVLDLKEDAQKGGLMDWCQTYADYHAIGFQKFRLSDPDPESWFNVLHGMGSDEARDTILASQDFEAAYYRALNELQLGQLITLLYMAREIDPSRYPIPTVYGIGKILSSPDLPAATREMVATVVASSPNFTKDDFHTLLRPEKAMAEAAGGLGARLTAMYETKAGRNALRDSGSRQPFDVTRPGLSYVGLDSSGKPELTRLVSSSVLQRMAVYAADINNGRIPKGTPRFLIVDEANFVSRKILLELLSRARGAGIACIVSTQGPTDWAARQPGEPDLTSLVQNTNVAIIMSQGERTNAELCADIIGRAEKNVISERVTDGTLIGTDGVTGSLSKKVDFLVSPDELRGLTIGESVIRVGKPVERRSWVKVLMRDPTVIAR